MSRWLHIVLLILLSGAPLWGQMVRGKVIDALHQAPLPNAVVLNRQDSTWVTTDDKGYFEIRARSSSQLIITHIGYEPVIVTVGVTSKVLLIQMKASHLNLHEVIVRGAHLNERMLEVPQAVGILSQQHLEKNNGANLADVINEIPGVFMQSGTLNTARVTIRGAGARTPYSTNKVRAYFNDIPLTSGDGETSLEDIDLGPLQRVEIIKGPTSSIYGAGLGGTIHLLTAAPFHFGTQAMLQNTMGSFGMQRQVVQLNTASNKRQLHLSISNLHSDGFRENSTYDRQAVTSALSIHPQENSTINILGNYTRLKAYIPSSVNENTFRNTPQQAARNWLEAQGFEAYDKVLLGVSFQHDWSQRLQSITSIFGQYKNAEEPRPFNILKEETRTIGIRSRVVSDANVLNIPIRWSAGFEAFRDAYDWSTYENLYKQNAGNGSVAGQLITDNEERRWYYNLFAQINWQLTPRLALQTGLNHNFTSYNYTDVFSQDMTNQSGSYSFDPIWSPRVALRYTLTDDDMVYLSTSHGFSPPSLEETLTPDGAINPEIRPETGWNYELGTRTQWFQGRLSTEVAMYRMQAKHLLVAQRTGPDTYIGVNTGKTDQYGVEWTFQGNLSLSDEWSARPYISGSWMTYEFTDFIHEEVDYSGNEVTGVPESILNAGFDLLEEAGWYVRLNYRYVGAMPMNDANSLYSDSYHLLHSKAGYQWELRKKLEVDVSVGVNNLTDEAYASMILINAVGFGGGAPRYYYPGEPRNYYGSVKVKYRFE